MDDGLIFPYRRSTDHADARVLTHAPAATTNRGRLLRGVVVVVVAGGLGVLRAGRQAC